MEGLIWKLLQDISPIRLALRPYILNRVMGVDTKAVMDNGDFGFDVEAVRAGNFAGQRCLPPYAPRDFHRLSPPLGFTLTRNFPYALDGHE
jgi:hypothetical protein